MSTADEPKKDNVLPFPDPATAAVSAALASPPEAGVAVRGPRAPKPQAPFVPHGLSCTCPKCAELRKSSEDNAHYAKGLRSLQVARSRRMLVRAIVLNLASIVEITPEAAVDRARLMVSALTDDEREP